MAGVGTISLQGQLSLEAARAQYEAFVRELESRPVKIPVTVGEQATGATAASFANPTGAPSAGPSAVERIDLANNASLAGRGIAEQPDAIDRLDQASAREEIIRGDSGSDVISSGGSPSRMSGFGTRGLFRGVAVALAAVQEVTKYVEANQQYGADLAGGQITAGNNPVAQAQLQVKLLEDQQKIARQGYESVGGIAGAGIGAIVGQALIPIPGIGAILGATVGHGLGDALGSTVYGAENAQSDAVSRAELQRTVEATRNVIEDSRVAREAVSARVGIGATGIVADLDHVDQQRDSLDQKLAERQRDNPESVPSLMAAQSEQRTNLNLEAQTYTRRAELGTIGLTQGSRAESIQALQDQIDSRENTIVSEMAKGIGPGRTFEDDPAIRYLTAQQQQIGREENADLAGYREQRDSAIGRFNQNPLEVLDAKYNADIEKAKTITDPNLRQSAFDAIGIDHNLAINQVEKDNEVRSFDLQASSMALRYQLGNNPLAATLTGIASREQDELVQVPDTHDAKYRTVRENIQTNAGLLEKLAIQDYADQSKLVSISQDAQADEVNYQLQNNPIGARAAGIAGSTLEEGNRLAFSGRNDAAERQRAIGEGQIDELQHQYTRGLSFQEFSTVDAIDSDNVVDPRKIFDSLADQKNKIASANFGSDSDAGNVPDLLNSILSAVGGLATNINSWANAN